MVSPQRRGVRRALGLIAVVLAAMPARAEQAALDPEQVYRAAAGSVYVIIAAATADDAKSLRNIGQGSAVAVGEHEAITNCHVIKGKPQIVLLRGNQVRQAVPARSDVPNDLCSLTVAGPPLGPIKNVRPFASLAVGERVYAIGSPKGQENTLSDGLVAGLRVRGGLRMAQITAPISQGSSGGGVFDRFGNLVGITSFVLYEAQSLNFAIAIDEFAPIASALPPAAPGRPAIVPPAASRAGGITSGAPLGLPPAPKPVPNATPGRGFTVELAVVQSEAEAVETWGALTTQYGDLLGRLQPRTQRFEQPGKGAAYRLLAGTIQDRGRASELCKALADRGHATCAVR